ncbi:MAG: lyase family protein, partial [Saprospiraceae bacterium]|nr:lyase family protein [Saprospiraceae bacterium]
MLKAISPIDGRYAGKTKELSDFFSEYALIKYRLYVEVQYFIALCELPLPQLEDFPKDKYDELVRMTNQFDESQAKKVKEIEAVTNHDVKAVEYYMKDIFDELGLSKYKEFIHFGLTSQDINNTSIPLTIQHAFLQVYVPMLEQLIGDLKKLAGDWAGIPMLARTHGQPASPTTLGKEFEVFVARLEAQLAQLKTVPH